jgi:hypothetical protein
MYFHKKKKKSRAGCDDASWAWQLLNSGWKPTQRATRPWTDALLMKLMLTEWQLRNQLPLLQLIKAYSTVCVYVILILLMD